MIDGLVLTPLKQICDERGKVMHMLRADAPHFTAFGEIYFSYVNVGVVKAWKLHKEMTQNIAVPYGKIRLVLFDGREESSTHGMIQELEVGGDNYNLVTIPPKLWYGFQGLTDPSALIANCASQWFEEEEVERCEVEESDIPFSW